MSESARVQLEAKPRATTCNHDPRNGTLERINMYTYRCRACGVLFKVGVMGKAVKR